MPSNSDRWSTTRSATLPTVQLPVKGRKRLSTSGRKPPSRPSFTFDANPVMPVRERSKKFLPGKAPRRKVHFARYDNAHSVHSPVEQVFQYPAIPEDLLMACFYSRKETSELRRLQTELAKCHKLSKGDEIARCIRCLRASIRQVDDSSMGSMTRDQAVQTLSESDMRGLEHHLVDSLIKHRKWGIKKILVVQQAYREQDPTQLETILRIWSIRVSASSSEYAHMIARADELSAT